MISLELAQKLKAAGLEWTPKNGDCFYDGCIGPLLVCHHLALNDNWVDKAANGTFAPRLDQLIAKIEARGWEADSVQHKGKYACDIAYLSDTVHTKYQTFAGETREDAAGLAYLWIMEQDAHV